MRGLRVVFGGMVIGSLTVAGFVSPGPVVADDTTPGPEFLVDAVEPPPGPPGTGTPTFPDDSTTVPSEPLEVVETPPGPTVVIDWSVPDRFGRTVNGGYVRPLSWPVTVNTCGSFTTAGHRVLGVAWRLTDTSGAEIARSSRCSQQVTVPRLGSYWVDATMTATNGTFTGRRKIEIKDYLIVVAGDSMASGEGNPDVPGHGDVRICGRSVADEMALLSSFSVSCALQLLDIVRNGPGALIEGGTPSTWYLDPDCHRSYRSGLTRAAKTIETRDPHSSVTFINVACSGAETRHFLEEYEGIYRDGEPGWDSGIKQAQADEIKSLVCGRGSCAGTQARRIDALFLSVGINNLDISGVLTECAKPEYLGPIDPEGCSEELDDEVGAALADLPAGFRAIDQRFADLGVRIGSILHAAYPTDVFSPSSNGCGVFAFINDIERDFLDDANDWLNLSLPRHASHYDWFPVWRDPTTRPWKGHGYCAGSQRWFVTFGQSLAQYTGLGPGAHRGTMHPNAAGHEALRQEFVNEFDQRIRPVTDEVVVSIEAVQALRSTIDSTLGGRLLLSVARAGTDGRSRWGSSRGLEMPEEVYRFPGVQVPLDAPVIMRLGLNDAERLRVGTIANFDMPPTRVSCPASDPGGTLPTAIDDNDPSDPDGERICLRANGRSYTVVGEHVSADDFGAGQLHFATDPTGRFGIRYRVYRPGQGPIISNPTR